MTPFDDSVAMKVLAEELLLSADNGNGGVEKSNDNKLDVDRIRNTILNAFEDMPKLVASASLGQVYKGTL